MKPTVILFLLSRPFVAIWDMLCALSPRIPLVVFRLVERLHLLFAGQHSEPCEVLSAVYAGGWVISLLATPGLLHSSIYLHQIEQHVSSGVCLYGFSALSLYWWTVVLFGGQPSGFIEDKRSALGWMHARMVGLTLGIIIWGALAILVSRPAITPGTFLWGAQAVYCAGVQMVMGWRIAVDKGIESQKIARAYRTSKASAPVAP